MDLDLDLEKQYSPSLFSKRFQNTENPREEVIKHFIRFSEYATKAALQKYKYRLNVRYAGEDNNQLMDIFFKDQEEGTPIFVYLHGGMWQDLDRSTSGPLVNTVIEDNYRVILLDYDLCPTVSLQDTIKQIRTFFIWLKGYVFDTSAPYVTLCGHSAGAHLLTTIFDETFCTPSLELDFIDQVYLISGLYDLTQMWNLTSANPNNILQLSAEKAAEVSPLLWAYNHKLIEIYQTTRFHVIVAENDSEAFKLQSINYYNLLRGYKLNVSYNLLANYDHFDIIQDCFNRNSPISIYIRRHLGLLQQIKDTPDQKN